MALDLTGPLVSSAWLADHLDDPQLRVIDVRGIVLPPTVPKPWYFGNRQAYLESHIPGAQFVDWTSDIIDPDDEVPVQVAPPERYQALMERLGIGDDSLVVAYDDHFSMFAGRFWWTLRYYGHEAVRVLDGGWKHWLAENRPTQSGDVQVAPAHFTPRPQPALRRTVEQVQEQLGGGGTCTLIDARKKEEYVGEQSRAARGGHIPGAGNLFYQRLASGPDETFLSPAQIATLFQEAGIDYSGPGEIVSYCNGGVSATPILLALSVLGRNDAALYDGSWNEWGNRSDLPLERS